MKNGQFEEYDINLIYKKLISPSKPIMVKGCDFFKQEDLLTLFQEKMEYLAKTGDSK